MAATSNPNALVHAVEQFLSERQAVAMREKDLVDSLNRMLTRMGYQVVPTEAAPAAARGRRGRRRRPGRPRAKAAARRRPRKTARRVRRKAARKAAPRAKAAGGRRAARKPARAKGGAVQAESTEKRQGQRPKSE